MIQKGKVIFEGKTYWLDLGTGNSDFECDILENGKWRPALKTEVDLFDLLERGKIISDKKEIERK
ncbi:MAG: hypothetical protein CO042_02290 [Parcubacteria group bacterium CG_4_9_14_0_2_um_filter_41_8]|nr:MAG: hypothetical protein CO042_02290 [Parcubacteria group bacterium CG_4_9_14_0_2_um_filter_41_8]